ncbi:MAG TPA: TonB-dependent receptor, partial [Thermoanaerobaculia bacterium]
AAGVLARISRGGLEATLHYGTRTKGVPGASYDTNFNQNEWTIDRRAFIDLSYNRKLTSQLGMVLRTYWDRYTYDGSYPMSPTLRDYSLGEKYGLESRFLWDARANDRVTFGAELLDADRVEYRYWGNGARNINGPFVSVSGYVQNEYQPLSNLSLTAGLRWEHNSAVGSWVDPRLAVVFNASPSSTFKVLYGEAYRAPDVYELQLYGNSLKPENVRTAEVVFEKRINPSLAMFASLYSNKAEGLIEIATAGDGSFQYQNDPAPLRATGAEVELDYRSPSGMWAYGSWSFAHTVDKDRADLVTNAPRHLVKLGVSTNPFGRVHGGLDLNYETSRATLDGTSTAPFLVVNATSSFALTKHLRAGLTVRNLFDRRYFNPVGSEFRAASMLQDGRTLEVMLRATR